MNILKLCKKSAIITSMIVLAIGCTQSSSVSKQGASLDQAKFTKTHYKQMLRQFSLTLTYLQPKPELLAAIDDAGSDSEVKKAYDEGIDAIVDDPFFLMRDFFMDYARQVMGVGQPGGNDTQNMEIQTFAWIIIKERPIDDLITSQNLAYDFDGNEVSSDFTGAYPSDQRAGIITMPNYISQWNSVFKFNFFREALALNLCDLAPWPKLNLLSWSEGNMNPKYLNDPENPIPCYSCHQYLTSVRYAFRFMQGNNGQYNEGIVRGNNHWGMENNGYFEPLEPGYDPENITALDAIAEEDAQQLYRLTSNGSPMDTPHAFGQAIAAHPRFAQCWTARTISMLTNTDFGITGTDSRVPEDFSATPEKQKFIDRWTETFEKNDRKIKELIRAFGKSNEYLISLSAKIQ